MNFKLLSLLTLASFVFAQGDPSTSGAGTDSGVATPTDAGGATPSGSGVPTTGTDLPPCLSSCITQAAQSAGCNPTENSCLCGPAFLGAAQNCVASSCSPQEQQAAMALAQQTCPSASGSSAALPSSASMSASGSATIRPTSIASGTMTQPTVTTRPITSAGASISGTRTGAPASATSTGGAVSGATAQSLWALAAGAFGIAVAL